MSKTDHKDGRGTPFASLYEEVTARVVAELERGSVPWVRPWGSAPGASGVGLPRNAASGRAYAGINILILWGQLFDCGYASQRWLTFRQAAALGGSVRKGERGVGVCYADRFVPKARRGNVASEADGEGSADEPGSVPFLRRYTVFNVDQCDGLPEHCTAFEPQLPDWQIVPEAEALARATLATIRHGGDCACYLPATDVILLPPQPAFFDPINYYRTKFHELGHWTGHPRRLNRDQSGAFGTKPYAFEELVAEMTAAFVCAALGIEPTVRHASYVASWLEVLRDDNRAIFRAASRASKAADFLLAFRPAAGTRPASPPSAAGEPDAASAESA